jgi:hypothetical protein
MSYIDSPYTDSSESDCEDLSHSSYSEFENVSFRWDDGARGCVCCGGYTFETTLYSTGTTNSTFEATVYTCHTTYDENYIITNRSNNILSYNGENILSLITFINNSCGNTINDNYMNFLHYLSDQ